MQQALKLENLPVEKIKLKVPPVNEVITALTGGLTQKYSEVRVESIDCPDLSQPPFNLAAKGLGGNPTVIQIGDPAYVVPNTLREKLYDFRDAFKVADVECSGFIIGAGGGCWPACDNFSEMCANVRADHGEVRNYTTEVFTTNQSMDGIVVRQAAVDDFRFACVGNLFVCRGETEKVIRISCRHRKSENDDFPGTINALLKAAFDYPVALGGVIRMVSGKAEHHVAPTFAEGMTCTEKLMSEFFLLPNISAPFISLGTLLTKNPPGWTVLNQHFHSFNQLNEGGHYHFDVTPDEAEYEAYLMFADTLCAVDKAEKAINVLDF